MARPSVPILSRELIFRTALRIIDTSGSESFSMGALAAALGVKPASLYNHVVNKREVIEGIREIVVSTIDCESFTDCSWVEALERFARSYRGAYSRHPNSIRLLTSVATTSPAAISMYSRVFLGMLEGGWPKELILSVVSSIESYARGAAIDLVSPDHVIDLDVARRSSPLLAEVLSSSYSDGECRAEEAFNLGLRTLLFGLSAQLESLKARESAYVGS